MKPRPLEVIGAQVFFWRNTPQWSSIFLSDIFLSGWSRRRNADQSLNRHDAACDQIRFSLVANNYSWFAD